MDLEGLMNPAGKVLTIVANIVQSRAGGYMVPLLDDEVMAVIIPKLDKIQNGLNDLRMKDQKVAKDLFEDALNSMRNKFQTFSSSSDEVKKRHGDKIESALLDAQKKAIEANNAGLGVTERLHSYKWIIATEMLRVLNEVTSKGKHGPTDLEWIKNRLTDAQEKCFKYLKKANEIREITDFIATKIPVEGYEKGWSFKFKDRTDQVCQLVNINMQVEEFFRFMENTYGATCLPQVKEGGTGGTWNLWNWWKVEGGGAGEAGEAGGAEGMDQEVQLLGDMAIDMPLVMGKNAVVVLLELFYAYRINEGIQVPSDQEARVEYAKKLIPLLGVIGNLPDLSEEVGLKDVAHMRNGGTAKASSYAGFSPAPDAFNDSQWRSQNVVSGVAFAEFIQRNLEAPVTPQILMLNSDNYGPANWKFVAEKDDGEWETLLDVKGLEWPTWLSINRFWIFPEKKTFKSFRLEISESTDLECQNVKLGIKLFSHAHVTV